VKEIVKIVIPALDASGKKLSAHFGRAPYFAWFDITDNKVIDSGVVMNTSDHFGGAGAPPEKIKNIGGEIVISSGMGIKAIDMFQSFNIAVLKGVSENVDENIQAFLEDNLTELTEGCLEGHNH
jgi:predicted Fe-Mo cluster-binding NifX family protein